MKEVHMDASNHSTVLFTVHFQPSRMIIDPSSPGGGDALEYYPVSDVQGTIYKLLDSSGVGVADYTYSPFGERLTSSAPSIYMPLGYGGTYSDDEIGLLYAKSRYYDPHTTRFTTKDSYRGSKGSTISQNRYIYCHQNPILYADPAGYAPVEGDHADPCTATDQDIHYEPTSAELAPPENLPNAPLDLTDKEMNRAENLKPGESFRAKDGSYVCNIGGHTLRITFDTSGKPSVREYGTELETDMTRGLENALSDPNVASLFQKYPKGATFWINHLWINYFDEFERTYHDQNQVQRFMFNAMTGWAAAAHIILESGTDADSKLFSAITDALLNGKKNGQDWGVGAEEFLVMMGFWQTHFNTKVTWQRNTNGVYDFPIFSLSIDFFGDQDISGLDSKIGLVDLVRIQSSMWLITSANGLYNGENSSVALEALIEGVKVGLGVLTSILGAPFAAEVAVGALCSVLIGGASGDDKIHNGFGFTQGMYKSNMNNGLTSVYLTNYRLNGTFTGMGLSAHYFNTLLKECSFGSHPTIGSMLHATDRYIDVAYGSKGSIFEGDLVDIIAKSFYSDYDRGELGTWIDEKRENP